MKKSETAWYLMKEAYRKKGLSKEEIANCIICKTTKVLNADSNLAECDHGTVAGEEAKRRRDSKMRAFFNINFLPRRDVTPIMWRTKDGEKIQVTDMNVSHLYNAYKLCERQAEDLKWWMDVFEQKAKRRGFRVQTKRSWLKRRVK